MSGRVVRPELLDDIADERSAAGLRDLVRINRLLGSHRVVRALFKGVEARCARFTVLDAGAASGDTGRAIRREFEHSTVVPLDRVPYRLASAQPPRIAADALALPSPPRSFDYVTCSLFLYHFTDERAVELLRSMLSVARRAVIVIDLERSALLRLLLPPLGAMLRWHAVTRHDAMRSVEAAFRPGELAQLARAGGASEFQVRRHVPWFRISLVAKP